MEVLRHPGDELLLPSCVTVGNFDGVHLGHRVLINECIEMSRVHNLASTVVTFDEHTSKKRLLNTLDEKRELVEKLGPQRFIVLDYREIKDWSPREFLEFLRDEVGARWWVAGPDHRFGRHGSGTPRTLLRSMDKWQMGLVVLPPMRFRGVVVKSGFVRGLVEAGDVEDAAYYLGYHYFVSGRVGEGRGIGSDMGFPTANLEPAPEKLLPGDGVYAVMVDDYIGVCHIGPRFPDRSFSFEVHLLDFEGDITGETLRVVFHKRLRDVRRFKDTNALAEQIREDVRRAREFFREG